MKEENKTYIKVIQYIKYLIQTGSIKEGDKLPAERELSLALNLSRNSIREALRTMETLGILESRQGSGNYLVCNIGKNFTETLTMMLLLGQVDYANLNEVRRAFEMEAFRVACNNVSKEYFEEIYTRLIAMERADAKEEAAKDREFHHQIVAITGNPIMIGIMEAMSDIVEKGIAHNLNDLDDGDKKKEKEYHQDIARGLINGDLELGLRGIQSHYDLIEEKIRNGKKLLPEKQGL